MEVDQLSTLLRDWKDDLSEVDEPLLYLEELQKIEHRHREILQLSGNLEDAYKHLLKIK